MRLRVHGKGVVGRLRLGSFEVFAGERKCVRVWGSDGARGRASLGFKLFGFGVQGQGAKETA